MDPIRNIVVPVDFSPLWQAAAQRAVALAGLDGATLHLVHAIRFPLIATPYEVSIPPEVWADIRRVAAEKMEVASKVVQELGIANVTTQIVESGDAARAIAAAAEAREADLVVMATHGHGPVRHAFLGSVAERSIRSVGCPVLAVKEDQNGAKAPIEKILLAVDFSAHSQRAVEVAAGLASRLGASIDLLHVFDLPADSRTYSAAYGAELLRMIQTSTTDSLESVRAWLHDDVSVSLHVHRGEPSAMIAELAGALGSNLIVMGSRGHGGLAHVLLGSVAERTFRTAPCSVLAVKTPADSNEP